MHEMPEVLEDMQQLASKRRAEEHAGKNHPSVEKRIGPRRLARVRPVDARSNSVGSCLEHNVGLRASGGMEKVH